jgi:hypothetical protein
MLSEPELGDEPLQLHRLVDIVESRLRRAHEETTQDTQDLTQVQGVIVEQRSAAKQENISLQTKFDEEKAQLQQVLRTKHQYSIEKPQEKYSTP